MSVFIMTKLYMFEQKIFFVLVLNINMHQQYIAHVFYEKKKI